MLLFFVFSNKKPKVTFKRQFTRTAQIFDTESKCINVKKITVEIHCKKWQCLNDK